MITTRPSAPPFEFGLLAWLENTRIALPLKGVECRFDVAGVVACVEMDQIFHQSTQQALECTYVFPLPAGAAIHRCEMHVNDRIIRARVESQADARQKYEEEKALGHRAALVEVERENIFTLTLGNVQPGDVVVVRLAWFQVLDRAGGDLRLLVPTCPGVRYIPGTPLLRASTGRGVQDDTDAVPDASRITPPRISELHPDAAYFSLTGRLDAGDVESGSTTSASHSVCVRERSDTVTVELIDRSAVPDRDFVLTWREPSARRLTPMGWHWQEEGETYALVELRAPDEIEGVDSEPHDIYFLADRSGSMEGAKWTQTCAAMRAFIGLLGDSDRVWISLFNDKVLDFAEAPLPPRRVLGDAGFDKLLRFRPISGTEMLPAVRHLLEKIGRHSAGRRTTVVLVTDGQVGNEEEILAAFRVAPEVRVHTFGIDTAINDAFLAALARQQRGTCQLQNPNDDIAGTIAALGGRLRRPVLTDLRVKGAWESPFETWPDLHAGEVVTFPLRGSGTTPPTLTGRSPDGREHSLPVTLGAPASRAIKLLWVRERLQALLGAGRDAEAIALAKTHCLLCKGAAFIAWDEAERVVVAQHTVVQPSMSPSQPARAVAAPSWHVSKVCFAPSPAPAFAHEAVIGYSANRSFAPSWPRSGNPAHALEVWKRARLPEALFEAWSPRPDQSPEEVVLAYHHLTSIGAFVEDLRSMPFGPATRICMERDISRGTETDPESCHEWIELTLHIWESLRAIQEDLAAAGVPLEVADALLAWAVADDKTADASTKALRKLATDLSDPVTSPEVRELLWESFVANHLGNDPATAARVSDWMRACQRATTPSPVSAV
jgi:Ca-activated chloride channel family protein